MNPRDRGQYCILKSSRTEDRLNFIPEIRDEDKRSNYQYNIADNPLLRVFLSVFHITIFYVINGKFGSKMQYLAGDHDIIYLVDIFYDIMVRKAYVFTIGNIWIAHKIISVGSAGQDHKMCSAICAYTYNDRMTAS